MILSAVPTVEQLCHSDRAVEHGIDNAPPPEVVLNMQKHLAPGLQKVSEMLGHPLTHSSGYRCQRLNELVGGSKTSAHMQGYAEDFICPAYGAPVDIVHKLVASGLKFDQLIQEGSWVHVSFDPRMRQMLETAHFSAGSKPSYTMGA